MSETLEPVSTEFPMVVYLRGDEEHFNDFCLNADQVMELLGIRRSRLNQISGKELRVGRTRIDSYIRPVYRKQDVQEYMQWIRPTATHKKSSDMLNEARNKLEEQSEQVSLQLSSRLESIVGSFSVNLQTQFFEQKKFSTGMLTSMRKNLSVSAHRLLDRMSFVQKQSVEHWEALRERFDEVENIQKDMEEFKTSTVHINDIVRHSERMLLEIQNSHKHMQEQMTILFQSLEDLKSRVPVPTPELPIQRQRRAQGSLKKAIQSSESIDKNSNAFQVAKYTPSWRRKKLTSRS